MGTSLLDPNEGTLRKLYFENNSPQIPKSPDASTLYSSNDGGGAGLGLTRSSFNTSLRSQRLEQSVRSITEQKVPVLRQKRQEPSAKMSEIEPEYFDGRRRKALDANRYATKKTIAQGMLDVALLTANASQLKYVLQLGNSHPFYELMLSLIVISIILQIVAGILFLVIGGLNMNDGSPNQKTANTLNDVIVVIVFLITLINVVISGFGIRASDPGQISSRKRL